jgi:hypothetical protein
MDGQGSTAEGKTGACVYILHCLLQRLETTHHGLVLDLASGRRE